MTTPTRLVHTPSRRAWLALATVAPMMLAAACSTPAPAPTPPDASLDVRRRFRFEDTPEGARLVLEESILFEFGKADFAGAALDALDALRPAFERARGAIIVEGHTDGVGNAAFNLDLSRRRAERVREELIKRRIAPERITARAMGASRPRRSPETTDQDRRLNRRAEFLFPGETVASLGGRELESQTDARLGQIGRLLDDAPADRAERPAPKP